MQYPERFTKEIIESLKPWEYSRKHELKNHFFGLSIDFVPIYLVLGIIILFLLKLDPVIIFVIAILSFFYSLFHFYKIFFDSQNVVLKKYEIKISNLKEEVSFMFISDMHYGKEYYGADVNKIRKIVDIINSRNKDLVIFGGDFICSSLDFSIAKEYAKVKAKNVIGIYGNHDSLYLEDNQDDKMPKQFLESMKDSGIKFLNNEGFKYKDIYFGGVTDLFSRNIDVEKAFAKDEDNNVRVLLSHHPDVFDLLRVQGNISLILSGHTHGGQIYLPGYGSLLPIPCRDRSYEKGIYKINKKQQLFISQGAGFSSTRMRLGTQCEVCEITLKPS